MNQKSRERSDAMACVNLGVADYMYVPPHTHTHTYAHPHGMETCGSGGLIKCANSEGIADARPRPTYTVYR